MDPYEVCTCATCTMHDGIDAVNLRREDTTWDEDERGMEAVLESWRDRAGDWRNGA